MGKFSVEKEYSGKQDFNPTSYYKQTPTHMQKYFTEFIGTFFLVLTIGLAGGAEHNHFAFIATGAMLTALVYMGWQISGSHFNPAITLGVFMRKGIDIKEAGIYWGVQLIAGIVAAALAGVLIMDDSFVFDFIRPGKGDNMIKALLVETLLTYLLTLVYLNVSAKANTQSNSFYGLAIGLTFLAISFTGESISGGAFNPAVGIGPNLVSAQFGYIWIYVVGPLLGGALAGFTFHFLHPKASA